MPAFFCFVAVAFGLTGSAPAYCLAPLLVLFGAWYAYSVYRRVFVRRDFDALILQGVVLSVFLLCMLLEKESAFLYRAMTGASLAFSGLVGAFIGRPIAMGPTYSGLYLVCLFFIAAVALSVFYREKPSFRHVLRFASLFLLWGVYIAFWTVLAENSFSLGLGFLEPLTGPLDFRALLLVFLLVAYLPVYRRSERENAAPPAGKRTKISALAGTALCVALYLISFIGSDIPETAEGRRVLFWDSGIDFSLPEEGLYGLDNAGMFGFLPRYLETRGYTCAVTETPDADALASADVLVIINPMYTPSEEDLDAIQSFVERGGGLLAAGDHTGDEQIRLPLNAILAPAGISYNFDSATPFKTLWADEFVTRRGPVFAGVSDAQIQVVVGASLETARGAKPLLIGRCGYSDAGDVANASDGFLGDRQFNRGERVGDLTLAAGAAYGSGRIMAFGDTSFLQNISIAYSYPLINNLFAYLAGDGLAAGAGGGADDTNDEDGVSSGAGDGADGGDNAFAGAGTGSPVAFPDANADGGAPLYTASCLIDAAHLPSFSADKSDDAPDGFIASVLRAGLIPYRNASASLSEAMDEAGDLCLVVLVEPASPLSESEERALDAFVKDGGCLLLFGTYKSPRAAKALFDHYGFSFENIPIGRVAPEAAPEMALWNACPLLYEGRPATETSAGEVESLVDVWGYSVVARRGFGDGFVYAFADGDFIKNKNLENISTYRKGNVDFIAGLLEAASGRAPAGANAEKEAGE